MTRVAKPKSVGVRAYADHEIAPRPLTAPALGAGEERYRILADNIAQLAWTADQAGSIVWYNQRWYDYTGTTLADAQGWGWRNVVHPDHVERGRGQDQPVLRNRRAMGRHLSDSRHFR